MNREYYCKVGSNAELRDMAEDLKEIGEKVDVHISMYDVIPEDNLWCWLGYEQDHKEWTIFKEEPEGILVGSENLIDKVVGKELPKFEVGRWYRLGKWISKFKEVKNNTEFWAESINTESRFYDKNGYLPLNKYTPKLITDLSEIQQYLPDGHPDKQTKLVEWYEYIDSSYSSFTKGKVYKCINPTNLNASCNFIDNEGKYNGYSGSNHKYFKPRPDYVPEDEFVLPEKWCIKVQKHSCPEVIREWRQRPLQNYGDWLDSGYICGDTGYHTGSAKSFPKGYTEITLEQFKKYVLKEEKKEVSEKVRKFKLGDTIYLIEDRNKNAPKGSSAKVVGYTDRYVNIEWINTKGKKQNNGAYYEKDFSLENPMKEEFKIGDWIATTNKMYVSYGKIVQVKNIDRDHIYVSPNGWWERKHIRKATPEEIASATKSEESYKVGDYVVITGNMNCSNNKIGDIGVITEIRTSNKDFRVRVEGRPEHGNWTRPTDLRKALPHEIPVSIKWKSIEKLLPSYMYGTDSISGKSPFIHYYGSGDPKSLLDREEIEVTIKKTVPKQFNIF